RRTISVESVHDLGQLDPEAIGQVVAEAQPLVRDADELHDVLLSRILLVHAADSRFVGHLKCPAKPRAKGGGVSSAANGPARVDVDLQDPPVGLTLLTVA